MRMARPSYNDLMEEVKELRAKVAPEQPSMQPMSLRVRGHLKKIARTDNPVEAQRLAKEALQWV